LAAGVKKQRIDLLLVERGFAENVQRAGRLIGAGCVQVDNRICSKAGHLVDPSCPIVVKAAKRFVSRGGDKLEAGLSGTGVNPHGYICADIGCSTGGFTDCLLQHGAKKVYCVDVGYGLLDWKLRQDGRVVVLERTNARHLTSQQIAEPLDLAVIDASFISLEPLLAPLLPLFRDAIRILALVKPQFQLPREMVGPGGIVGDAALHQQALAMVRQFGQDLGLQCGGIVASPIRGAKGNQEFFMLLIDSSAGKSNGTINLDQGENDVVSTAD
jgi:23S rRNA (cytidine1920-2'-O)/16S rRNA (cytidine1409-2'-O)-methyltransferase